VSNQTNPPAHTQ